MQASKRAAMESLVARQKRDIFVCPNAVREDMRPFWSLQVTHRNGMAVFSPEQELQPLGNLALTMQHGQPPQQFMTFERVILLTVIGRNLGRVAAYDQPANWAELTQTFHTWHGRPQHEPLCLPRQQHFAAAGLDAFARRREQSQRPVSPELYASVPELPAVYWAFMPGTTPQPVNSLAMQRLLREKFGEGIDVAAAFAEHAADVLQQSATPPDGQLPCEAQNTTRFVLYPAALVQRGYEPVPGAVAAFESVRALLGAQVRNPFAATGQIQLDNPALSVSRQCALPLDVLRSNPTPKTIERLLSTMRQRVGAMSVLFTDDMLLDALHQPAKALTLSLTSDTEDATLVAAVNTVLPPYYRGGATPGDIRDAMYNTKRPLSLSRATWLQLLRADSAVTMEDAMSQVASVLAVPKMLFSATPPAAAKHATSDIGTVVDYAAPLSTAD